MVYAVRPFAVRVSWATENSFMGSRATPLQGARRPPVESTIWPVPFSSPGKLMASECGSIHVPVVMWATGRSVVGEWEPSPHPYRNPPGFTVASSLRDTQESLERSKLSVRPGIRTIERFRFRPRGDSIRWRSGYTLRICGRYRNAARFQKTTSILG